jgi:glycosyltransferase involved in cell wall biosynthesis
MNLCLISREYPPFFGGGIGTYAAQFAKAWSSRGHRVVVVTISGDGRLTRARDGAIGITTVRLPFVQGDDWSGPAPSIATPETIAVFNQLWQVGALAMQVAAALPGLIEEFSIDAIEAPDTGALPWFALNARRNGRGWASAGRPVPLVTHIHSPTEWIERWNRSVEPGRRAAEIGRMEEDSARWSDALLCPSRALAAWAGPRWNRAATVEVVPYPLGDLEPIARQSSAGGANLRQAAAARDPRRILFVGRLEPRKGIDTLLAGFALAVAQGADLHLDIVGRDAFDRRIGTWFGARMLETLVPAPVRDRITLHGPLPPDRVADLRRAAGIAAIPSPMDNYPYVCMEAMAEGLPVVAAAAGGMAEMIRDPQDGLLFHPGDPEACAAALHHAAALSPTARAEMGRSAAARILDLCANDTVLRARESHFQRAIEHAANADRTWHNRAPADRPRVVVINRGSSPADAIARLVTAVSSEHPTAPVFAHGWLRSPANSSAILAFGSPTLEGLAIAPRTLGPIAVRSHALDDPASAAQIHRHTSTDQTESWSEAATPDTWPLIRTLLERGHQGAVVPDAITDQPHPIPLLSQLSIRPTPDLLTKVLPRLMAAESATKSVSPTSTTPKSGPAYRLLRKIYRSFRGSSFPASPHP